MNKLIKSICVVCAVIICASTHLSAVSKNVVTEYYSADMLSNFESEIDAKQVVSSAPINISAKYAILIEQNSKMVLYENGADEKRSFASITKIMTLLLVMEAINDGKIKLTDEITCSEHAASMGGSQIWLEPGEKMTVDHLLKATVIGSANDAATMLCEAVCGTEETFVAKMNEKAKKLNMKNTHFENCTGLDADGHYSSARDIAIMSAELLKHDLIKKYSTVWMDTLRDGATQLVNTNKLVRFYSGATGLKTGTTSKAGCCVSASATKNGLSLIAVVLGCENSNSRFSDARKLLDYGFANYQYKTVDLLNKDYTKLNVINGVEKSVKLKYDKNVGLLLDKGSADKVGLKYILPENVTAPVKRGATLGKIEIYIDGKLVESRKIYAAETIDKMTYWFGLKRLFRALFTL